MEIEVIRRDSKEQWEKLKSNKKPLINTLSNSLNKNYFYNEVDLTNLANKTLNTNYSIGLIEKY